MKFGTSHKASTTLIFESNQDTTNFNMKSKDWKKLWFYVIFVSGSGICFCNSIQLVKATNPNRQAKKEELTSTISFLPDSRLSGESLKQSDSNHDRTKKNLILESNTNNTNKISSEVRILSQKKINISISQTDKCSGNIWYPSDSKNFWNAIISETTKNGIGKQSGKNIRSTGKNNVSLECLDLSILNQKLPIKIGQNQEPSPPSPAVTETQQESPTTPPVAENAQDPPPLESQPTDFPEPNPSEIEQKLDILEDDYSQRLERLLQLIEENKEKQQSFNREIFVRVREVPIEVPLPPEQKQPPSIEEPVTKFKPVGYLLANFGYFHTSNIFSSRTNAIDDGLIFTGLTLAAKPLKIAPRTYLNGSINGNIIKYSNQSEFDYNQIRFNLGMYQQLTNRMYAEIGWNNQQLFYSKNSDRFNFSSGDKFLNENSFRLSVGRRDSLAPKLNLDSFYQLRLSLTNPPEKRNRIINFLWLSLNYSLEKSLRLGIDYQFNLSNFLERSREDQYHRLSGKLRYGISELSSISLQSGFTLGGSTDSNIDFDGWFFSVNYSWDLGQF